MKIVRRLASTYVSSFVFGFIPTVSYALGLGDIQLHSHLNEPLEAEIVLEDTKGIEPSDIIVGLATPSEFQKAGLESTGWVNSIHFKVLSGTNGKFIAQLTTEHPVKDPFADLLVQATWPDGKIIKEYTLLLDPPKMIFENQPLTAQVSTRKKKAIQKETSDQVSVTVTTSSQNSKNVSFGGQYGPVYHETLWSIAKKLVAKTPYTVHQGVAAIVEKNPQAFKNGNMHQMIEGVVLNLPTEDELSLQTKSGGTSKNTKTIEPAVAKPLTLVNQFPQDLTGDGKDKGKQDKSNVPPPQVSQRLTMIEEALDTLKRSNEDIVQKNQHLQHQNETLTTQLAQKEAEINQLKAVMQNDPALSQHPLAVQQPIKSTASESFAVVVPDYPKKPKVEPPVEQKNAAVNMPLQGLPKDILAKDQKVVEGASPKSQSLGEIDSAAKPSHSTKRDVIYFIFIFILSCSIIGWIWFSRQSLLLLANSLSNRFGKNIKFNLKKSQPPVQPMPRANLSTKTPQMEHAEIGQPSFEIPFDLGKALNAVAEEEEKASNRDRNSEQNIESIISIPSVEDADIYMAYERYPQAEKILLEVLKNNPDEWDALLKLLELYVLTEKYDEYKKWHDHVPRELKEISPIVWSKIELLQEKVQMEKSIDIGNKIVKDAPTSSAPTFEFEAPSSENNNPAPKQKDLPIPSVEITESAPKAEPKPQKEMPKIDMDITEPKIKKKSTIQQDLPKPIVEISDDKSQPEFQFEPEPEPEPELQSQPQPSKSTWGKLELVKEPEDLQSQLSLAKAYIDVGDIEPARDILVNILSQGTKEEAKEAQALLDRINKV